MAKITYLLFLLLPVLGFSQSEKLIHGSVLSGESKLKDIDVVNMNSKTSVTSNSDGNFSILVKPDDVLFIISKEYTDRKIILTQEKIDQNNIVIYLERKPIELEEVKIDRKIKVRPIITQADLDEIKIAKDARALKPLNVYDGTIPNGIDFMRLGKGFINLFKNKDKVNPEKPLPPIPLKEFLAMNFDRDFYTKKLKLKPEEINLFISFCEADPKAKAISEHQNVLETLDFLLSKNEEFKKLQR